MRLRLLGLCTALVFTGCDTEPMPTTIEIVYPAEQLLTDVEAAFDAVIYDQDGAPITNLIAPVIWSSQEPAALRFTNNVAYPVDARLDVGIIAQYQHLQAYGTVSINRNLNDLTAHTIYLTQGVTDSENPLALVPNRAALLRIFVVVEGHHTYTDPPMVRVEAASGAMTAQYELTQDAPGILSAFDQSSLANSYNATIPADVIDSGLTLNIVYDPNDEIYGVSGTEVYTPEFEYSGIHHQMYVPTTFPGYTAKQTDDIQRWTSRMSEQEGYDNVLMRVYPFPEVVKSDHEPFQSEADLSTGEGWIQWLGEMEILRRAEGRGNYYYFGTGYGPVGGGIAGVAYLGGLSSVGIPNDYVATHEIGHSLRLRHTPCGSPDGVDPNYPYNAGNIGHWGYDFKSQQLKEPTLADVMGYCMPWWISDYSFEKVMVWRHERATMPTAAPERVVLISGSIKETGITVNPVFRIDAIPDVVSDGRYMVEGFGPDGRSVFQYRFTPLEIDHSDVEHFFVAIPLDAEVSSLTVSGPVGAVTITGTDSTWAIIRNRNGQVVQIDRDWKGTPNNRVTISGLPIR